MALTGKALFDAIAAAAQPLVGNAYAFNGLNYTLKWVASVSGPYSSLANVNGAYGPVPLVPAGKDALVFRYTVAAGNGRAAVDPVNDIRVLTSLSLPDNPTNAQLVAALKQLLEDAR